MDKRVNCKRNNELMSFTKTDFFFEFRDFKSSEKLNNVKQKD